MRSTAQVFALVFGVVFLLVGVAGFCVSGGTSVVLSLHACWGGCSDEPVQPTLVVARIS
jgi:hypothetical protein